MSTDEYYNIYMSFLIIFMTKKPYCCFPVSEIILFLLIYAGRYAIILL